MVLHGPFPVLAHSARLAHPKEPTTVPRPHRSIAAAEGYFFEGVGAGAFLCSRAFFLRCRSFLQRLIGRDPRPMERL
jgi:hypothetical protein